MTIQTKRPKISISITVEPDLIAAVDEIKRETKTTRSGIISKCLEELVHNRKEELMVRYYKTMTQEDEEFAKKSVKIIQEIASSWSD